MRSYLGWVDFSERDRNDVLDLIRLLRKKETVDELGVGVVRDTLAEQFFPGTSTIQTRPRYLLMVPWLYQRLEGLLSRRAHYNEKLRREREIGHRLRDYEIELIFGLIANETSGRGGIIGRVAKEKLERFPSNIYWAGLARLGIRQWDMTQSQYHRYLASRYGGSSGETLSAMFQMRKDEADETVLARPREMWCPQLPSPPTGFHKEVDLSLTQEEAQFLMERVAIAAPKSLLDYLLRGDWGDVADGGVWNHPVVEIVPHELARVVEHARCFAEVHHVAALLYNLLLMRAKNDQEGIQDFEERIQAWSDTLMPRWNKLQRWCSAFEDFWWLSELAPTRGRHQRSTQDHRFLSRWCDLLTGCDQPEVVMELPEAHQLLRIREVELKGTRARLTHPEALDRWKGESGTVQIAYRWGTARRFLADVHDALRGDEEAESTEEN